VLKEEVEVEDEYPEDEREEASDQQDLKRCWVSLENIKIQPENIEVEGEEKEEMPTADIEEEYQIILLKPLSNSPERSVIKQSVILSKRHTDNSAGVATVRKPTDNTKKFPCLECDKIFHRAARLRQHVITKHTEHAGPKKFSCPLCGEGFNYATRLRDHQNTHHGGPKIHRGPEVLNCSVCFKTLHSKRDLTLHMVGTHKKKNSLNCNLCDFKTWLRPEMMAHLYQDHQISGGPEIESNYTCEPEDFSYNYEKKLVRNDLVICSICGLETNWKISKHMRVFHDDTPCEDCGMILKGVKEYKLHRKRVHTKEVILEEENAKKVNPEFICSTCGKGYSVKQSYLDHLVTHRPTPPYHKVCEHCGDQFDSRKEYAKHYNRKHAVPKRSEGKCEDCGKTFKNLKQHVKIAHLGLKKTRKPVPCPECNKIFSSNENLSYHMNVHTGAKPYQCFYCENAYQNRSNRNNHMKKSHPELYQTQKNNETDEVESQDQNTITFVV